MTILNEVSFVWILEKDGIWSYDKNNGWRLGEKGMWGWGVYSKVENDVVFF